MSSSPASRPRDHTSLGVLGGFPRRVCINEGSTVVSLLGLTALDAATTNTGLAAVDCSDRHTISGLWMANVPLHLARWGATATTPAAPSPSPSLITAQGVASPKSVTNKTPDRLLLCIAVTNRDISGISRRMKLSHLRSK